MLSFEHPVDYSKMWSHFWDSPELKDGNWYVFGYYGVMKWLKSHRALYVFYKVKKRPSMPCECKNASSWNFIYWLKDQKAIYENTLCNCSVSLGWEDKTALNMLDILSIIDGNIGPGARPNLKCNYEVPVDLYLRLLIQCDTSSSDLKFFPFNLAKICRGCRLSAMGDLTCECSNLLVKLVSVSYSLPNLLTELRMLICELLTMVTHAT